MSRVKKGREEKNSYYVIPPPPPFLVVGGENHFWHGLECLVGSEHGGGAKKDDSRKKNKWGVIGCAPFQRQQQRGRLSSPSKLSAVAYISTLSGISEAILQHSTGSQTHFQNTSYVAQSLKNKECLQADNIYTQWNLTQPEFSP